MSIKIVLTEDNNSLAESIKEKLDLFGEEIQFLYRAVNGVDLLEKLAKNDVPDIILMDIEMPEMDGITAALNVNELFPQIKIIMLTVFDDEEKIFQSIKAGASGYLLKDEKPDRIFEGIKIIMDGGASMSPSIAAKVLNILKNPMPIKEASPEKFSLSKREFEVLEQISKGLDYNQISENLFISPSTVRKHIENIYKKLHVHNKMQAVQKAIKHRLI